MVLEKQKKLRKIELIFTDDEINSTVHCEYDIKILEDGEEVYKRKHRENAKFSELKSKIADAKIYVDPTNVA